MKRTYSEIEEPVFPDNVPLPITLSKEQQAAVDAVVRDHQSIFLTGDPGTGKSLVVDQIRDALTQEGLRIVEVTAPTGVAALNVGGSTLQQWAGIGVASIGLYNIIRKKHTAQKRIENVDVLIIDEISMLVPSIFDELEKVFRKVRKCDAVFGGVQMVLVGDFLQLPPVEKNKSEFAIPQKRASTFVFETKAWDKLFNTNPNPKASSIHMLTRSYRALEDEFLKILSECRSGRLTTKSICALQSRVLSPLNPSVSVSPFAIRLFSRTAIVDQYNKDQLNALSQEDEHEYRSQDTISLPMTTSNNNNSSSSSDVCTDEDEIAQEFLARLPIEPVLILRKGARVMLRRNLWVEGGLVNGRCGTVIGFQSQFVPNISLTLDDEAFICAKTTSTNHSNARGVDFWFSKKARVSIRDKYIKELCNAPIVRFDALNEDLSSPLGRAQTITIAPSEWVVERPRKLPSGKIEYFEIAKRRQVPLTLSWAVSIHKSQGTTLAEAVISAGSVFVHAQAYVALSRVTTLKGVVLTSFNPKRIYAHPRAVEWWRKQQQQKQIES